MAPVEQIGIHDTEVKQVAWLPFAEAGQRLSYPSDRELLRQVADATPFGDQGE